MWSRAQADAIAFVSCTMPPLLAAYGPAKDAPKIDIIEPMLMILPRPAFVISGWTAFEQRKALVRLGSRTWCHSASVYSCGCLRMLGPALLTRMATPPNVPPV